MAQILKDDVRNNILNAALELLLTNDANVVSMRQIALKANMTVGNLYRYYQSKEDLLNELYQPVLDQINAMIGRYANNQLVLFQDAKDIEFDRSLVPFIIQNISGELVDIFATNKLSVKLLVENKQLMNDVIAWLMGVLQIMSDVSYGDEYYELMAFTIINGLIHIHSKSYDKEMMNEVINHFLVKMIDV